MIAQYPYFAPDRPFMAPAPQASKADIKLLEMFTGHKASLMILNKVPKKNIRNEEITMFERNLKAEQAAQFIDKNASTVHTLDYYKRHKAATNKLAANREIDGESLTQNVFKR